MLPSNYVRSGDLHQRRGSKYDRNTESAFASGMTDQQTRCPTGPADYNANEACVGNRSIRNARIKCEPSVTFTTAATHRNITSAHVKRRLSRSNSRSAMTTTRRDNSKMRLRPDSGAMSTLGVEQDAFALETFSGSPPKGTQGSETLMIFHKTDHHLGPGVCDYSIAQTLLDLRPKSPKAIIGNAVRFPRNKLKDYVGSTNHQYV